MKLSRRMLGMTAGAMLVLNLGLPAQAADETPDLLVKRVSADVLETIKKDASLRNGDSTKINALVNDKVMPYVDIAYEYSNGNEATAWQAESDEEKGWQYGMGLRFKF